MTLQQMDEVLRVWKTRLAAIAENLLELQSESAYQSLTGTGGLDKVQVTGLTAARVQPALAAMNTMYEQFGLLQSTIDKAEALRKELPAFFGGEAKARELQELLFGRSIAVATGEIPLEQRTLLGAARMPERMTPEELLIPMERSFAAARDAVMSADRAWMEFGERCGQCEVEIARLREQRALPSALLAPALDAAEAKLKTVGAHVKADPLGAEGELQSQVEPLLAEVRGRVARAEQLGAQLGAARARCEDFARVHQQAMEIWADARDKVATGAALPEPVAQDRFQGVVDWLERLEHKRDEGAVDAVNVGLRHWNAAAEACVVQDRRVLEVARARVEQRSELRGRLHALKAKARSFGVAEEKRLADLVGRAEQLLYSKPADLEGAATIVAQYERQLSANRREA